MAGKGAKKACWRCHHVLFSGGLFSGITSFKMRCSNIGCVDEDGKQTMNKISVSQKFYVVVSAIIVFVIVFTYQVVKSQAHKTVNCDSFQTQVAAQVVFNSDPIKYKKLDSNNNNIACEDLIQ